MQYDDAISYVSHIDYVRNFLFSLRLVGKILPKKLNAIMPWKSVIIEGITLSYTFLFLDKSTKTCAMASSYLLKSNSEQHLPIYLGVYCK